MNPESSQHFLTTGASPARARAKTAYTRVHYEDAANSVLAPALTKQTRARLTLENPMFVAQTPLPSSSHTIRIEARF